jgi:hypothetical protein
MFPRRTPLGSLAFASCTWFWKIKWVVGGYSRSHCYLLCSADKSNRLSPSRKCFDALRHSDETFNPSKLIGWLILELRRCKMFISGINLVNWCHSNALQNVTNLSGKRSTAVLVLHQFDDRSKYEWESPGVSLLSLFRWLICSIQGR